MISDLRGEGQMNIVLFDSWCYFKLFATPPTAPPPLPFPRSRFISSAPVSEFHFAAEIESCVRCPASPNVPGKRLIPSAAGEEKGVKAVRRVKCNQGYCLSRQASAKNLPPPPKRLIGEITLRGVIAEWKAIAKYSDARKEKNTHTRDYLSWRLIHQY